MVADTTAALELDPAYVKALIRRATAHTALDDFRSALADYEAVLEIDPDVPVAKVRVS